jgi:hypothetical protein
MENTDLNPDPKIALRLALAEKLYTLESERITLAKKLLSAQIFLALVFLVVTFIATGMVADFLSTHPKSSPFWAYFMAGVVLLISFVLIWASNTNYYKQSYNINTKKTFFNALCSLYGDTFNYRPVNQQIKDKLNVLLDTVGERLNLGVVEYIYYDDNFQDFSQEWEMLFGDLNVTYKQGKSLTTKFYNYYLLIPREHQAIIPQTLEAYGDKLPENTEILYKESENVLAVFVENQEAINYDFSLRNSLRANKTLEDIQVNLEKNRAIFEHLTALFEPKAQNS